MRTTYYVRDATGNAMGTYEQRNFVSSGNRSRLIHKESALYGSSRLGLYRPDSVLTPATAPLYTAPWTKFTIATAADTTTRGFAGRRVGKKQYELNDHLGNVRAVVSDAKRADSLYYDHTAQALSFTLKAQLLSSFNYYPFGMLQPGGEINLKNYRYGYNGMEKDDEVRGSGNSYTTLHRLYDPRIGRWLSVDPEADVTPETSPYVGMGNMPIIGNDPDGDICVPCLVILGYIASDILFNTQHAEAPGTDNSPAALQRAQDTRNAISSVNAVGSFALNPGKGSQQVSAKLAIKTAKEINKRITKPAQAPKAPATKTGSYTNTHESGKKYHGKGGEKRMNESAKEKAEKYNDPVVDQDFTPANNDREAFKQESRRLDQDRVGDTPGHKNPNNYNNRDSPGTKYRKEDGEN